jgi:hypothetical protein
MKSYLDNMNYFSSDATQHTPDHQKPENMVNMPNLYSVIHELSNVVKKCMEGIKVNQQMIKNLIINSINLNEECRKYNPDSIVLLIKTQ